MHSRKESQNQRPIHCMIPLYGIPIKGRSMRTEIAKVRKWGINYKGLSQRSWGFLSCVVLFVFLEKGCDETVLCIDKVVIP